MQWGTTQELLKWGVDAADEGWLTLRYRKVYRGYLQPNKLEVPLLITETGIDGMIAGHPGPAGQGLEGLRGLLGARPAHGPRRRRQLHAAVGLV